MLHKVLLFLAFVVVFAKCQDGTDDEIEDDKGGSGACFSGLCALGGGICVDGLCECFDSRYCDHCQYSAGMMDLYPCVPFDLIGGGRCLTNNYGCNGNGQCVFNRNDDRVCLCSDGWMCPNCNVRIEDFLAEGENASCPEPQFIPFQTGGGQCQTDGDCGNFQGVCTNSTCKCHTDRSCPHCQVDIWTVPIVGCPAINEFGGASCSNHNECHEPYGQCVNARCVCGINRICSDCSLSLEEFANASGKCPPIDREEIPVGGGNCTKETDCHNLVGGQCVNGFCKCFPGWGCAYCNKPLAEISDADECLEVSGADTLTASNFLSKTLIISSLLALLWNWI